MSKSLIWSGDVDDALVRLVYKGNWTKLVLCSEGGDIYAARAICDYLLKRGNKEVLVTGKCFSSATAIAISGSHCSSTPGTRFMVHKPHTTGVEGGVSVLKNETKELDEWLDWYVDLLVTRTNLSESDWMDLLEAETYMGAPAALDAGLIDKID